MTWGVATAWHAFYPADRLAKVACGAFADISSVSAGKKRGFCRLLSGISWRSLMRYLGARP
jgi:hypothetical protein